MQTQGVTTAVASVVGSFLSAAQHEIASPEKLLNQLGTSSHVMHLVMLDVMSRHNQYIKRV